MGVKEKVDVSDHLSLGGLRRTGAAVGSTRSEHEKNDINGILVRQSPGPTVPVVNDIKTTSGEKPRPILFCVVINFLCSSYAQIYVSQ